MMKFWRKISNLGLNESENSFDVRLIVLTNRLNFLLAIILQLIFIVVVQLSLKNGTPVFTLEHCRLLFQVLICLIVIFLSSKSWHKVSRFIVAYVPVFVLFVIPVLIGIVNDTSFFYFPYIIILFAFNSQLLLDIRKEKGIYFLSIAFYTLLLIFAEALLKYKGPENLTAPDLIEHFFITLKIMQLSIFLLLSTSLYYIKRLYYKFEEELRMKNHKLDTQNEELQSALNHIKYAQQKMVHSAKMASLGTLASGVAHEINNPLNHIFGGIDILKNSLSQLFSKIEVNKELNQIAEDIKLSSSIIGEGADKASTIVNSLMTFSTIGESQKQNVDLNKLISDSMLFLKSRVPGNVNVIENYKSKAKPSIYSDKMHQVFLGIIDNAIYASTHFMDDGPKLIEIKTFEKKEKGFDKVVVEVYNTGNSIPEENLPRIFDPFFTTKDPDKSSGLGLSEAFSIVKEHKGNIFVENVSGGVKFIVELPH